MILDMIQEWFKELLIDGIISNLTGMFDTLNTKVGEIAGEVGMTPAAWNSSIFNMIRNLSETVIVPIAGIILTFVMCYELIQLIIEKNNLHDFDTWIFFKWIFKTFCAVLIVTNTWNIVMAVFDVAQNVVSQSAGVIISDAGIDISGVVGDLETQLADWSVGALLGLWFQSVFVGLCTQILSICIFLVIYGRMIEVYLVTVFGHIHRADSLCHDGQPGMGLHGAELSSLPAGPGLPGLSHYDLCGHLCGAGGGHLHIRRQHIRGHLGLHGLYGPAVLHPVQDRQPCKIPVRRSLKEADI